MLVTHKLKTWPEPFRAAYIGHKRFEFRKNDRDFKVYDVLKLLEYEPKHAIFTGAFKDVVVTYILYGPDFGIPDGYCIMSVEPV